MTGPVRPGPNHRKNYRWFLNSQRTQTYQRESPVARIRKPPPSSANESQSISNLFNHVSNKQMFQMRMWALPHAVRDALNIRIAFRPDKLLPLSLSFHKVWVGSSLIIRNISRMKLTTENDISNKTWGPPFWYVRFKFSTFNISFIKILSRVCVDC